jgi:glycosyltransferase involved in cell wall biosynthesis
MHVRDLATAQGKRGKTLPMVFETLSPSFARRIRDAGVECRSVAERSRAAIIPTLRRLIIDRQIDIAHSHGYDATWWTLATLATLPSSRRPRLVVTCHGWIETTPKFRFMSALDRTANRLAAGVVVVSDELVATALASANRARAFALVPNGIPVRSLRPAEHGARSRWGLPAGIPLVGAIGRQSREKRHDVFVAACRLIALRRADVHFVLAGGGPLRDETARRVVAAGLEDRFHLLGVVDDPELLLSELAVLVQSSDIETTSRVVLEAMMQARPVVATDVGGTATIVRHAVDGVLVPPRDPTKIAAEVLSLLAAPDVAARLGDRARTAVAARFDVADMAAAVDDVYSAVLGRGSALHGTWTRS